MPEEGTLTGASNPRLIAVAPSKIVNRQSALTSFPEVKDGKQQPHCGAYISVDLEFVLF